jgi:hypothetical protein
MLSASQLAANQSNAQFSTGPRSTSGKSASSQNARTHGLTARHLCIAPEDQPAFEALESALRGELRPEGELESALFDRILHGQWNLHKIAAHEAVLLAAFDPFNEKHSLALNRFALYRSRTESSLYKAQAALRGLQEERQLRSIVLEDPAAFPPILSIANIQKHWTVLKQRNKRTRSTPGQPPSDTPQNPTRSDH